MAAMLSVRFAPAIIAAVRRFARQDGKTVSRWIRDLVAAELASPNRQPPVDVSLYPTTRTAASSEVKWLSVDCLPCTATGYYQP